MTTVLKSLVVGAAMAIFAPIPMTFAYVMWLSFVSPGIARQGDGEVGWDLVTLVRNAPWIWFVDGAIFIIATLLMYRYFARRRS